MSVLVRQSGYLVLLFVNDFIQLGAEGLEIEVTEPVILDGEAFPAGRYRVEQGPELTFVTP